MVLGEKSYSLHFKLKKSWKTKQQTHEFKDWYKMKKKKEQKNRIAKI
jgi:hypothetical protein